MMYTRIRTLKRLCRGVCLFLVLSLGLFAVGCYGSFPLTHAVYRMNSNVAESMVEDNTARKVAQSVIFWVLVIIPVYDVAIFADVVVLNLIEFWTGDAVRIGAVQERDGVRVALEPSAQDGSEAVLTVTRDGKVVTEQHVVRVDDTRFEMRDAHGAVTGTVHQTPEGVIQLADRQGHVIQTLAAEDVAAISRK